MSDNIYYKIAPPYWWSLSSKISLTSSQSSGKWILSSSLSWVCSCFVSVFLTSYSSWSYIQKVTQIILNLINKMVSTPN